MNEQERSEFEASFPEYDFTLRPDGEYENTGVYVAWKAWFVARRSQDEQVRELCGLIKTLHSEELQDRGEVPVLLDDIATLAAQLKEQQDD